MTTAKREINSEQERYAEYQPRVLQRSRELPSVASYYREYDQADEFVSERFDSAIDEDITRDRYAANYSDVERFQIDLPSGMVAEEDEALAPTMQTMRAITMSSTFSESMSQIERNQKIKINTRGKATIIGFAIAVLSLIIVICINAVAIAGIVSSVSSLENQLNAAAGDLNDKNNELGNVTHPDVSDIPSDYVKPDSGNTIDIVVPNVKPNTPITAPTNWFDSFCDFLSGIFGR